MNANVFNAAISDVLHRFRHQVKACHVVAQLIEFDQVATGSNSPFNQSPGRRTIFLQQADDQLPLGDVPPITVFQSNKFLQVTGVLLVLPVVGASLQQDAATAERQHNLARGEV